MYGIRSGHDRVIQLDAMHQLVSTCVKRVECLTCTDLERRKESSVM